MTPRDMFIKMGGMYHSIDMGKEYDALLNEVGDIQKFNNNIKKEYNKYRIKKLERIL
jgi:hypothetical protein